MFQPPALGGKLVLLRIAPRLVPAVPAPAHVVDEQRDVVKLTVVELPSPLVEIGRHGLVAGLKIPSAVVGEVLHGPSPLVWMDDGPVPVVRNGRTRLRLSRVAETRLWGRDSARGSCGGRWTMASHRGGSASSVAPSSGRE